MELGEDVEGELEAVDAGLPAIGDPVLRLVAAWLLGFASPHTRRSYAGDLNGWLRFCTEHDIDPLQARRPHLDAWARSLEAAGLRPRTVARRLAAASSWYGFLVDEEVRPTSPAEHVRRPKVGDRGETPGLTRAELRRMLAAAVRYGSPRSVALMTLLAHTGLRIGEALSRDVEHLAHDRGHRTLTCADPGQASADLCAVGLVARPAPGG